MATDNLTSPMEDLFSDLIPKQDEQKKDMSDLFSDLVPAEPKPTGEKPVLDPYAGFPLQTDPTFILRGVDKAKTYLDEALTPKPIINLPPATPEEAEWRNEYEALVQMDRAAHTKRGEDLEQRGVMPFSEWTTTSAFKKQVEINPEDSLPIKALKGARNVLSFRPRPVEKDDPIVVAGAKAFMNALGGLGSFMTSPLGAGTMAAAPLRVLAPAIRYAYAADMTKNLFEMVPEIYDNWGKMSPAQRTEAIVEGLFTTGLAAGLTAPELKVLNRVRRNLSTDMPLSDRPLEYTRVPDTELGTRIEIAPLKQGLLTELGPLGLFDKPAAPVAAPVQARVASDIDQRVMAEREADAQALKLRNAVDEARKISNPTDAQLAEIGQRIVSPDITAADMRGAIAKTDYRNPHEFRPAFQPAEGAPIVGEKGSTHQAIIDAKGMDADWKFANFERMAPDHPARGFMLGDQFLSREQASGLLGEKEPLTSERLKELQDKAPVPTTTAPGQPMLTVRQQAHVDNVKSVITAETGDIRPIKVSYRPGWKSATNKIVEGETVGDQIEINAAAFERFGERLRPAIREELGHRLLETDEGKAFVQQHMKDTPMTAQDVLELQSKGYRGTFEDFTNEFIAKQARIKSPFWKQLVDRFRIWAKQKARISLTPAEAARAILRTLQKREVEGRLRWSDGQSRTGAKTSLGEDTIRELERRIGAKDPASPIYTRAIFIQRKLNGEPTFLKINRSEEWIRKNTGGYVKSIDPEKACQKGFLANVQLERMQNTLGDLYNSDMAWELLRRCEDAGLEVPCYQCYIFSARAGGGTMAAKFTRGTAAYAFDVEKLSPAEKKIFKEISLRHYSSTDAKVEHYPGLMVEFVDLAREGLPVGGYTKDLPFVKFIAPTGAYFNISVGRNARVSVKDVRAARALRDKHPNIGIVYVPFTDAELLQSIVKPWVDHVLPWHGSGQARAELARKLGDPNIIDYTREQNEMAPVGGMTLEDFWKLPQEEQRRAIRNKNLFQKGSKGNIPESEHKGDFDTYMRLVKERGTLPKFPITLQQLQRMGKTDLYMKLIGPEYGKRGSPYPYQPVKPVFDTSDIGEVIRRRRDFLQSQSHAYTKIANQIMREAKTGGVKYTPPDPPDMGEGSAIRYDNLIEPPARRSLGGDEEPLNFGTKRLPDAGKFLVAMRDPKTGKVAISDQDVHSTLQAKAGQEYSEPGYIDDSGKFVIRTKEAAEKPEATAPVSSLEEAMQAVIRESNNVAAKAYAKAYLDTGDKNTLLYVWGNLAGWRGPRAKDVKAFIKQAASGKRHSLGDLDAQYDEAIKNNDRETAQRLVDEAAKRAGYTVGPLYHGGDFKGNEFKPDNMGWHGVKRGYFLVSDPRVAKFFHRATGATGEPMRAFVRLDNPIDYENLRYLPWDNFEKYSEIMRKTKHDGFAYRAWDLPFESRQKLGIKEGEPPPLNVAVLDSSQIKLADPITRDDAGNVIPLSERFNPKSKDIRYSLAEDEDAAVKKMLEIGTDYDKSVAEKWKSLPEEVKQAVRDLNVYEAEMEKKYGRLEWGAGTGTWHTGKDPAKAAISRRTNKVEALVNQHVPGFGDTAITFSRRWGRFEQYFPTQERRSLGGEPDMERAIDEVSPYVIESYHKEFGVDKADAEFVAFIKRTHPDIFAESVKDPTRTERGVADDIAQSRIETIAQNHKMDPQELYSAAVKKIYEEPAAKPSPAASLLEKLKDPDTRNAAEAAIDEFRRGVDEEGDHTNNAWDTLYEAGITRDEAELFRQTFYSKRETLSGLEKRISASAAEGRRSLGDDEDLLKSAEDYFERVDRHIQSVLNEVKGNAKRLSWKKIPADTLKKIWLEYGKRGTVSDIEGLSKIKEVVLDNIARLKAVTRLVGHDIMSPEDLAKEAGVEMSKKNWDKMYQTGFIRDEYSDYAFRWLDPLYDKIHKATTADELVPLIDRVLNIIHQRGDLAAKFVEGGSKTLLDVANQGGYSTPEGGLDQRRRSLGEESLDPTSIQNAVVDQERAKRGLRPAMEVAQKDFGRVWDNVMQQISRDPGAQDRLIDELRNKPRALNDEEDAMLLHRQINLQTQFRIESSDLAKAIDEQAVHPENQGNVEELKIRVSALSDKLLDLYDIGKAVGTETGRGLNARKMMANEDYTLASLEMQKRAAKGGEPLNDKERAHLQQIADEYRFANDKLQERIAEREAKISELEAQAQLDRIAREAAAEKPFSDVVLRYAEEIVKRVDAKADAARARMRERMARTSIAVDPTVILDLAEIGASHIAHIGLDFTKWSLKMAEEFGDWVKPHLDDVFKAAKKSLENEAVGVPVKKRQKKVVAAITQADSINAIGKRITEKLQAKEPESITYQVHKLARAFVEQGITDRNKLIDAVHAVLKQADPLITRREAMDAISGYGKFKQLPMDQVSAVLRDLKGQMQQIAKLEDLSKTPPELSKTGLQRRIPTDEERRLIKQVEEKKKAVNYEPTDPATQLRSALQAVKQRLANDIKDLEKQIADRKKIIRVKTTLVYDPEALRLKARRDELKATFYEVFGKPVISDEKRLELDIASTQRAIDELERKLATGDLAPEPKKINRPAAPGLEQLKQERERLSKQVAEARKKPESLRYAEGLERRLKTVLASIAEVEKRIASGDVSARTRPVMVNRPEATPELEMARQKLDMLNEQMRELRKGPQKSEEEIRLDTWKKRTQSRIEEFEAKIATKDYSRKAKPKPIVLDEEGVRLKAKVERVKKQWEEERKADELAKRKGWQKGLDWFVRWERAFKLSSPVVFGKLSAAALTRAVTTTAEEAVGAGYSLVLPWLARRAPREGYININAMARAAAKGLTKGMEDAWQTLTKGAADIDVTFGDKIIDKDWANIFGQMHGALKAPIKRAEFELALAKRTAHAIRNGVDVTQPEVQFRLSVEALNDGYRTIFMNHGFTSDAWNMVVNTLMHAKNYPIRGEVTARFMRFLLPIVRVPVNIVAETATGVTGVPVASARLMFNVLFGKMKDMNPEVADSIMRQFKKGSIGLGLIAFGFANAEWIGGYDWREARKKGEAKTGGFQIPALAGVPGFDQYGNVPRWMTHAPWFELMQMGATMRRTAEKHLASGEHKGLGEGMLEAWLGLIEETPFVGQMLRIDRIFNSKAQRILYFGELAKSTATPALLQRAAEWIDKASTGIEKRRPVTDDYAKGIYQHVALGVPGLRETVPPDRRNKGY